MKTLGLYALVGLAVSGCVVPAARYEESRSAIRVEQEAHRRTQLRLSELSRKNEELGDKLGTREKRIEKLEAELAEAQLTADVAGAERRFATEVVEQLRGELGRTGEHLREAHGDKSKLALALKAAEARARKLAQCESEAADNAAIVRDLALALHGPIESGEVELVVADGKPSVRVPGKELTAEVVEATGKKVVAALASITQRHAESRVRIQETGAGIVAEESTARLRAVSDLLVKAGLGSARIEIAPAVAGGQGSPAVEIAVFSDADAPDPS